MGVLTQATARGDVLLHRGADNGFGVRWLDSQDGGRSFAPVDLAGWSAACVLSDVEGREVRRVPCAVGADGVAFAALRPADLAGLPSSGRWKIDATHDRDVVLATNYAPGIRGTGTWAEVRRNRRVNPGFESGSTSQWSSNAGVAGVVLEATTEDAHSGGFSCKVTSPGGGLNRGINATLTYPMAPPAGVVTASVWVKAAAGLALRLSIQERSPSGTYLNEEGVSFTATGDWQRVSVTRTNIAAGNLVTTPVYLTTAEAAVFYVDDFLVEWVDRTLPYFDGSSADGSVDPDMRSRYLGSTLTSESVLEIETVAGYVPQGATPGLSRIAGKPALRLIPFGTAGAPRVDLPIPAAARAAGVLRGTLHVTGVLGAGHSNVRRLAVSTPISYSPVAPNVPGVTEHRVAYGPLTGTYLAHIYAGSWAGGGDVWWTDPGLYSAGYDGPAFDGDTPPRDGVHYRWRGDLSEAYIPASGRVERLGDGYWRAED